MPAGLQVHGLHTRLFPEQRVPWRLCLAQACVLIVSSYSPVCCKAGDLTPDQLVSAKFIALPLCQVACMSGLCVGSLL